MMAAGSWRFEAGRGATVNLTFVFRTMPQGSSQETLATVFRNKYEVEIRRSQDEAAAEQ
jgi:hypothetical protein